MNYMSRPTHCCGISDIEGLNSPGRFTAPAAIAFLITHNTHNYTQYALNESPKVRSRAGKAHFIFTYARDIKKKTGARSLNGTKRLVTLKNFIEKNKLGTVLTTEPCGNPSYAGQTIIQSLIFTPDAQAMCEYARKNFLSSCRTWGPTKEDRWGNSVW